MSEDSSNATTNIGDIAKVLPNSHSPNSTRKRLSELYHDVLKAPVEFSTSVIDSAALNIVNALEERAPGSLGAPGSLERKRALILYHRFFTREYQTYKNRESGRLPIN